MRKGFQCTIGDEHLSKTAAGIHVAQFYQHWLNELLHLVRFVAQMLVASVVNSVSP